MKLQKMTVAAVAIAAALTMTACGSDDKTDSPTTTSKSATATTSTTDVAAPELPTSAELNGKVAQALDETVPAADKVNLVQGAEQDPELINQVAAAAKAAGAQVEILDPVTDTGSETAAASLNIVVNGQPLQQGLQASFVYEDGVWKLSKTTACQIVGVAGLTSPACAA
ncbi:hypothetical protein EEB12_27170 [Rhodococcus sp. WS1]|uniref:Low molecular weight antigen MTB12-like C-terminal domain-containing protein n=2 Tax=Nocardiaceae TaxID=85025 RepID=A0A8I1A5F6_RHOER|nr:hypothetical protein H351_15990 [Rhodococcus erythropolis R138]ATI35879.1 hypothetical protein CPI83_12570 [Rhodococcus sp. H-CA8f]MBH5147357.1 hypothetical protein [Rhodococcus erythropolis]NRH30115.1 hypothetical protein [Rhodococcus sp. MS13]RAL32117.1 hypothetical protein CVN56_24190 [Rhodococcus sp. AQ5-07]ROZ53843.1 hypothetical protein EEB12_27170 [Rhodococcus sp. WS1]TQC36691.1 hypothetical protein EEB16_16260 [Rhodococcus sp. WS7]